LATDGGVGADLREQVVADGVGIGSGHQAEHAREGPERIVEDRRIADEDALFRIAAVADRRAADEARLAAAALRRRRALVGAGLRHGAAAAEAAALAGVGRAVERVDRLTVVVGVALRLAVAAAALRHVHAEARAAE